MVKAKSNGKESAKKASKPGKKEPKRLDKTDESTDIPAIPSTSEWKGRKIAKVSIVHCKSWQVYKKRASEYITLLASSNLAASDMESEMNPAGAVIKRGSFEITIVDEDGKSDLVWSGLKLGPPRRLKFPDFVEFIEDVRKKLI